MIGAPDSRPVVVGVNGPQHTYRRAVAFALRESTLRHSDIRLVHGCQPSGGQARARSGQIAQEQQQRQARRQLRAAAQRLVSSAQTMLQSFAASMRVRAWRRSSRNLGQLRWL